jgi:glycosyltransferase involved in cell wall biosynthesis
MKVALVHELLTMKGGAETVLKMFADMFPDAPIYTLLYNEQKLGDWFPKERVRASGHWPLALPNSHFSFLPSQFFNHHLYLPFFPAAVEAWDFSEFDLVISSSSAFAHGIITNGKPKHLCFVNSPARYLWDRTHDVQARSGIAKAYLSPLFHKLRVWDAESAMRPDKILTSSKEVQRRVQLYWDRASEVLYPPVDDFWFAEKKNLKAQMEHPEYFLIVSTLAAYKRIDIAIEACNKTGKYLKVVGEGSDMARLKKLAGPTIEFYGRRENDELADLYANAIATIFPGNEDYGLVPLESMASGTPVIAYRVGGALETVKEHETGEYFDEPKAESLAQTLEKFDHKKYSKQMCQKRAQKFGKSEFVQLLSAHIDRLMA